MAGRWSRLPDREPNATRRTTARTEALLERHGVLTRGAVMAEQVVGGFSGGLPGAAGVRGEQPGPARLLRRDPGRGPVRHARARSTGCAPSPRPTALPGGAVVLAATDPANVYGAALPWPERPAAGDPEAVDVGEGTGSEPEASGHRAGRKAGALVVLVDGELVLYVERGGKTLLSWTEDEHVLKEAATALSSAVSAGALGRMVVQKADGASVHTSTPLSAALQAAGFAATARRAARLRRVRRARPCCAPGVASACCVRGSAALQESRGTLQKPERGGGQRQRRGCSQRANSRVSAGMTHVARAAARPRRSPTAAAAAPAARRPGAASRTAGTAR